MTYRATCLALTWCQVERADCTLAHELKILEFPTEVKYIIPITFTGVFTAQFTPIYMSPVRTGPAMRDMLAICEGALSN